LNLFEAKIDTVERVPWEEGLSLGPPNCHSQTNFADNAKNKTNVAGK